MMKRAFIILAGLFIFIKSPAIFQDTQVLDSLEAYSSHLNWQKVFLHLDKSSYQAGETIWFRAYLIDGITNRPVMPSNNLFVELINYSGESVAVRLLLSGNGGAYGDIHLDSDLPEGNYVLRAYTSWMRNFDEEDYFTRHLYIVNPDYENRIPRLQVLRNRIFNRKIERMSNNYEVDFYPEGGNFVAGLTNRVAFRVTDKLGRGQDAVGRIVDQSGNLVVKIGTDIEGTGVFEIEPVRGNSYSALLSVNGGSQSSFGLPELQDQGFTLRVDQDDPGLIVRVAYTDNQQNPQSPDEVIIVAHTRGEICFSGSYPMNRNHLDIAIEKELFRSGIAHLTVFSDTYEPVAERLVFIDRQDNLILAAKIDTVNLFEKDYLNFQLNASDNKGDPVMGTFSLSAVTGTGVQGPDHPDILSYLLFNSDLKGNLEFPDIYFHRTGSKSLVADRLLLTAEWNRFRWDNILSGEWPAINYSGEPGLAIAGRLKDPAIDMPIEGHPVQLSVKSGYDDNFMTTTDQNGYFSFSNLFYEGEVRMELGGRRLARGYPPEIELSIKESWGYNYEPGMHTAELRVTSRGEDWERVRQRTRSPFTAAPGRVAAPQEFGRPDQTIFIDHDNVYEHDILELLTNKAVGLIIEGQHIRLHGQTTLYGRLEVEYMINGRFADKNRFLGTPLRDIERIEIYRHSSTAAFGSRGGSGVINIYIIEPGYRGFLDVLELVVQGYYEPTDFYSDVLTSHLANNDPDREQTVYWEPDLVTRIDGSVSFLLPLQEKAGPLDFTIKGSGFDGAPGLFRFVLENRD